MPIDLDKLMIYPMITNKQVIVIPVNEMRISSTVQLPPNKTLANWNTINIAVIITIIIIKILIISENFAILADSFD